ncbi:MAG TPA: phospholipase [Nitrospiraceae bacterium]|nr:phospholipase [Nitrospiraceae bacterium]
MPTEFITDKAIYDRVVQEMVIEAGRYVWIATADMKDLHVKRGHKMVPFLGVLSDMIEKGISVRLLHAKEPGPNFRKDFDRFPPLIEGLERMLCPRVHFKSVIVDGEKAYTGSANLTGAGMGAKSENRRNFESGILTSDPVIVNGIMNQFDQVWAGGYCGPCGRKQYCTDCPL